MASLGSLTVALGLDAAHFTSGLTKSEYQAKRFADQMSGKVAVGILKAEGALRILDSAARLAGEAFQTLILDTGNFKDLEEKTGASAEALASLALAAGTSGASMEDIGASIVKLTKNLTGVDDESKAAGAALTALRIDIAQFKELDAASQMERLARALASFQDGSGKTAVMEALARGASNLLPFMKELGAEGGRQIILTQKQIELADAYTDQQARARTELKLFAQAALTEATPALTELSKAFLVAAKELLGLGRNADELARNTAVREFAQNAVLWIGEFVDSLKKVGAEIRSFVATTKQEFETLKFAGKVLGSTLPEIADFLLKDIGPLKEANKQRVDAIKNADKAALDALNAGSLGMADALRKGFEQQRSLEEPDNAREAKRFKERANDIVTKPTIKFRGVDKNRSEKTGGGGRDLVAAKLKQDLDTEIRLIREFGEQQRDAYEFANRFVEIVYDDGNLALTEFFSTQKRIRDAGLRSTLDGIDAEIDALRAYAKAAKPEERAEAERDITEAVEKRSGVVKRAGQDAILIAERERQEIERLRDQYKDFQVTLADLRGDTAGAANIRIDQQVQEARRRVSAAGGDQREVQEFRTRLEGTERLSVAQNDYNRLLERARNAEESILLAAQASGATELETLRAVGAAREGSLQQLSELTARANELALALGTPDAIRFAEDLGMAFKRATLEVDPLLTKIRDVAQEMGDAIAFGFEDAIVSGKGLRETLQGIGQDILRITTRKLITEPIAKQLTGLIGGVGPNTIGGDAGTVASGGLIGSIMGALGFGKITEQAKGITPSTDTSAISAGFARLQVAGINPTTQALLGLKSAADAAAQSFGVRSGIAIPTSNVIDGATGDFSRMDRDKSIVEIFKADELGSSLEDARKNTEGFSSVLPVAGALLSTLASSGGKAGSALSILPSIIQAIATSSAGKEVASGVGSFFSSLFSSGGAGASSGSFGSFATHHTGGIAGHGTQTRVADPIIFRDAKRYHDSGLAQGKAILGLRHKEVPAILFEDEEVLMADDPRHRDNIPPSLLNRIERSSIQSVIRDNLKSDSVIDKSSYQFRNDRSLANNFERQTFSQKVIDGAVLSAIPIPQSERLPALGIAPMTFNSQSIGKAAQPEVVPGREKVFGTPQNTDAISGKVEPKTFVFEGRQLLLTGSERGRIDPNPIADSQKAALSSVGISPTLAPVSITGSLAPASIVVATDFGGGKATGGATAPRTLYEVAEQRDEAFIVGGRQYPLQKQDETWGWAKGNKYESSNRSALDDKSRDIPSLLSGIGFGGKKSGGGPTEPRTLYEVAETRTEVLNLGGRKLILSRDTQRASPEKLLQAVGVGGAKTAKPQPIVPRSPSIESIRSIFGKVDIGGAMAGGGPTMPRTIYPVAENRPETFDVSGRQFLLTGSERGRIDPNPADSSDRSQTTIINVNVQPTTDRATANQTAAMVARKVAIANARFN